MVVIDATGYRSDEHTAWRWLFQRCNERRNRIVASVGAPLLWMLPLELGAIFTADAPDLWSIRSVTVRLPGGDVALTRDVLHYGDRFEPGSLERARALVDELRSADESHRSALVQSLRRLAEEELAHGHVAEAADVLRNDLAPLRQAIDGPLELAKIDRSEAGVLSALGRSSEALAILRDRVAPTFERQGTAYQRALTHRAIAEALAGTGDLAGRGDNLGNWTADLPPQPPVTWKRRGQLYGPPRWQAELRAKLEHHYGESSTPRAPVHVAGPIASSDRLVKDAVLLFPWITTARNVLAVEMESGGVYRAVRERCPLLAIRGISDIVGLKRAEAWTLFACASAAAFTRAFLRTRPVAVGSLVGVPADP